MSTRRLLTKKALAEALGCHPRTVAEWQDDGMPVAVRGRGGRPSKYDLAACRAWKMARDAAVAKAGVVDVAVERARKEHAQALLAEQAYQVRARLLVPVEEMERAWSTEQAAVRAKLLALPQAFADRLARAVLQSGIAGAEHAIRQMVEEVLMELADMPRPPVTRQDLSA